jgi:hypothetical protein
VAPGEEADEQPLQHRVLSDDHALDLVEHLLEGLACLASQPVGVVDVCHLSSME